DSAVHTSGKPSGSRERRAATGPSTCCTTCGLRNARHAASESQSRVSFSSTRMYTVCASSRPEGMEVAPVAFTETQPLEDHMKAVLGDTVIAEAPKDDLIKIESNWYFPPSSVNMDLLIES